ERAAVDPAAEVDHGARLEVAAVDPRHQRGGLCGGGLAEGGGPGEDLEGPLGEGAGLGRGEEFHGEGVLIEADDDEAALEVAEDDGAAGEVRVVAPDAVEAGVVVGRVGVD